MNVVRHNHVMAQRNPEISAATSVDLETLLGCPQIWDGFAVTGATRDEVNWISRKDSV